MNSYKVLILDDEPKACRLLNSLLDEYCEKVEEIKATSDVHEGLALMATFNPDILFLDINMPKMSGFEFLDQLKEYKGKIVFVTAYQEFAIRAFKYSAFDYLLKPVKIGDLVAAVNRIEEQDSSIKVDSNIEELVAALFSKEKYSESIAIHDKGGLVFIQTTDILYLEGQGNYTKIYCKEQSFLATKTLKSFEKILDPRIYIRVHRSYIVNIKKVLRLSSEEGGELILSNNFRIPVSRRRRHVLERFSA